MPIPLQHDRLPLNVPRLIIQPRKRPLRDLAPTLLRHPMRKHIHPRARAARRPELTVASNHPLPLARPLDVREHLPRHPHGAVVRRRLHAARQHPARGRDHRPRARREQRLDLLGARLHKRLQLRRDGREERRLRPADQQVVEARAGGVGRRRRDLQAGARRHGRVERGADVVELDVDARRDQRRRGAERGQREHGLRARADDVERSGDVEDLEGDQEDAELDGCHFRGGVGVGGGAKSEKMGGMNLLLLVLVLNGSGERCL